MRSCLKRQDVLLFKDLNLGRAYHLFVPKYEHKQLGGSLLVDQEGWTRVARWRDAHAFPGNCVVL